MSSSIDQNLQNFLPVYDTVPEEWEEARPFFVEQLKRISEAVNVRELGWYIETQLPAGKNFIATTATPQQNRTVFRKVIDISPVANGANAVAHGIAFDSQFTLVQTWVSCTDPTGLTAATFTYSELTLDSVNINFNSPQAYDRGYCVIEFILEI